MDINVTLFGEMLTFAIFIWVTMKYIWPPVAKILEERQHKIAAGLEAAERSHRDLELAQKNIAEHLREAKEQANTILDQAQQRATSLIEEGKAHANKECARLLAKNKIDIEQEIVKNKKELQKQMGDLIVQAVAKILQQKVDLTTQQKLIDQVIEQI